MIISPSQQKALSATGELGELALSWLSTYRSAAPEATLFSALRGAEASVADGWLSWATPEQAQQFLLILSDVTADERSAHQAALAAAQETRAAEFRAESAARESAIHRIAGGRTIEELERSALDACPDRFDDACTIAVDGDRLTTRIRARNHTDYVLEWPTGASQWTVSGGKTPFHDKWP